MTTLKDILLELRAIRIGIQTLLQLRGSTLDLRRVAMEPLNSMEPPVAALRKKPREPLHIIHKNPEKLRAIETLTALGDESELMFQYMKEQFGPVAEAGARKFYEEEILRGRKQR